MKRRFWVLLATLAMVVGLVMLPGCGGTKGASTKADPAVAEQAAPKQDTSEQGTSSEQDDTTSEDAPATSAKQAAAIDEDGTYTSKDDVALYIHTYGHLPDNYVTKDEAEDAGWKTEGLNIDEACPGKSIGGDRFGNREKKLPTAKGRTWTECDIDYHGGRSRGAKRIVFSNDGLIFYTDDHYKTFEQLY